MDGKRLAWCRRPKLSAETLRSLNVPPLVAQVLYHRGIDTQAKLDALLSAGPDILSDPYALPGMAAAVERVRLATARGETIGLFGDFDVDGVAGSALLARAVGGLGGQVVPYLPHRLAEGHGLNAEAVRALHAQRVTLLLTVDCGITSRHEVGLARDLGIDVLITDHHAPPSQLPPAYAILNPRLAATTSPTAGLSGAGLAFKLAQALMEKPDAAAMASLNQLAALGTIADVAPLLRENRAIVKEGLRSLHTDPLPGLDALTSCAGVEPQAIDVEGVSFILAPRLNAAGRMEHASIAYSLLSAPTVEAATPYAESLEGLNQERQRLTEACHQAAREQVRAWEAVPPLILVADEGFSPGVTGLVASRLVEEFYRPAVVVALQDVARASARSIPEFDVIAALERCRDLFLRYGGHPQAAGFVMERAWLPALQERLLAVASRHLAGVELRPHIDVDALITLRSLNGETLRWLRALEPYGPGNPPPVFLARDLEVLQPRAMGENGQHLRLALRQGGVVWEAVAFRQGDRLPQEGTRLDAVFTLGTDWWRGSEILSLRVLDLQPTP